VTAAEDARLKGNLHFTREKRVKSRNQQQLLRFCREQQGDALVEIYLFTSFLFHPLH